MAVGVERVVIARSSQRHALRKIECRQLIGERQIGHDIERIVSAGLRAGDIIAAMAWRIARRGDIKLSVAAIT